MDFLLENFKHLTATPKNVQQIKKMVLQLAVQGYLTAKWREENPDVEPARFLLKQIKEEKEQLVTVGKVKREKQFPRITEEEKVFNLPLKWEWEQLGKYTINRDGLRIPLSKHERATRKGYYDYYGASGIIDKIDDFLYNGEYLLIGEDGANLVARSTPIAFIAKGKFWVNNHAHVLECFEFTSIRYLEIYINSIDLKPFVTGGFQPKLSQGNLNKIPVSIPPLAEQYVIVSKVESLFDQIDQLYALALKKINYRENTAKVLLGQINSAGNDSGFQQVWHLLNTNFKNIIQSKESVKQLRQSILQLAIQGKLTAQWRKENPDVESASFLLERIKVEKEKLIKEQIIKREKSWSKISDNEMIITLPKNWGYVRLGTICSKIGSGSTPKGGDYVLTGIPFFRSQNIHNYSLVHDDIKFISSSVQNQMKGTKVQCNDILLNITGGSMGRCALVPKDFEEGNVSQHVAIIRSIIITNSYLHKFILSPYFQKLIFSSTTGAGREGLPKYNLEQFCVFLPPIEEQKQIVSKVNQLMIWCDELERLITNHNNYHERMMYAVVKEPITCKEEVINT